MTTPYIPDENNLPPSSGTAASPLLGLGGKAIFIQKDRLKNVPTIRDSKLAENDPRQTLNDSRTIPGWCELIGRLIKAAWSDSLGVCPVVFTHDYALLPQDPKSLQGAIIVWDVVSMVPADYCGHKEIKPRVRETRLGAQTLSGVDRAGNTIALPPAIGSDVQWVWAQSFDAVVKFTVYGDTYSRKNEYLYKFLDLMVTYTGVFIQTGLQSCILRGILQEALYDPPRNEEFPNQSVLYNIRVERQTVANYTAIEQVLVDAGVVNALTGAIGDDLRATVSGVPESLILPTA
jgi:hypothetical protein